MTNFLMTSDLNEMIPALMESAVEELFIISPYIKMNSTLRNLLEAKDKEGVAMKILCAKRPKDMPFFSELENIDIRIFDQLHGKAYFNEQDVVISSMNMIELGNSKNLEFGVYFSKDSEPALYNHVRDGLEGCFCSVSPIEVLPWEGELQYLKRKRPVSSKPTHNGFCIRCRNEISFNMHKPLCPDCYASWSKYKNFSFNERYCHSCGSVNFHANFNRPLCYKCYSKNDRCAA